MGIGRSGSSADIQDPSLLEVLQTTTSLRQQSCALLDLINQHHASSTTPRRGAALPPEAVKGRMALLDHLTSLRNQNRRLAYRIRDTKATTSVSRAEVDRLHLGLQNLYYEERHLLGEIAGCEEYVHPYTQLPLISDEDFFSRYPEWVTRKDEEGEGNGERGLMEARILEEKREREELEAQRLELVKRKTELIKQNAKRKENLGNLDRQLEAFIEAAKAIQKTFEKGI